MIRVAIILVLLIITEILVWYCHSLEDEITKLERELKWLRKVVNDK